MTIKRNKLIKELIYKSKYLGIKECSLILYNFLKNEIHNLSDDEINTFDELLYLDDITLWNLISCIDQKPLKDAKKNKLIKRIQLFKSNR